MVTVYRNLESGTDKKAISNNSYTICRLKMSRNPRIFKVIEKSQSQTANIDDKILLSTHHHTTEARSFKPSHKSQEVTMYRAR